jgi:hypothetical protein
MTTMNLAIKNTLSVPPLNKRIWLWLKDHPNKTAREIELAIGETRPGHVSNSVSDLYTRGMVSARAVNNSVYPNARKTNRGRSFVNVYAALGSEFELLPRPKTPSKVIAKHTANTPVPSEPEKPVAKFAINIENMTLSEARALYLKLKEFFG